MFIYSSDAEHDRLIQDMLSWKSSEKLDKKIISDFAQQVIRDFDSWKKRHNVIPLITLEAFSGLWCREREHSRA